MNARQLNTWKQLVRQCKTQCERRQFSSINIASEIRSEAIVAAGALVELVTPEMAELLEWLANYTDFTTPDTCNQDACRGCASRGATEQCKMDGRNARALAARIREALEANDGN